MYRQVFCKCVRLMQHLPNSKLECVCVCKSVCIIQANTTTLNMNYIRVVTEYYPTRFLFYSLRSGTCSSQLNILQHRQICWLLRCGVFGRRALSSLFCIWQWSGMDCTATAWKGKNKCFPEGVGRSWEAMQIGASKREAHVHRCQFSLVVVEVMMMMQHCIINLSASENFKPHWVKVHGEAFELGLFWPQPWDFTFFFSFFHGKKRLSTAVKRFHNKVYVSPAVRHQIISCTQKKNRGHVSQLLLLVSACVLATAALWLMIPGSVSDHSLLATSSSSTASRLLWARHVYSVSGMNGGCAEGHRVKISSFVCVDLKTNNSSSSSLCPNSKLTSWFTQDINIKREIQQWRDQMC